MTDIELVSACDCDSPFSDIQSNIETFETSHVYSDGNLQLDVRGTRFKVHQSILAMHSETFRDMFGLPPTQSTTRIQDEPITLDDSPQAFDQLMNSIYKGIEFIRGAPIRDHLDVIELAQKYQMHAIEAQLQQHISSLLPACPSTPVLASERFLPYQRDHTLPRTVLRFGAPELRPWAFYALAVPIISGIDLANKSTYDLPSLLATFGTTFAYELLVLLRLIQDTPLKWCRRISEFYSTNCPQATIPFPHCSRTARRFDNSSPLFIPSDPMRVAILSPMVGKIKNLKKHMEGDYEHGGWCNNCKRDLKKIPTDIIHELHEGLVECTARLDYSRF